MSVSRKPVPSLDIESPNHSFPPAPIRTPPAPPPAPPPKSPARPSEPLSQVEYDSDFDWDACDDEEEEEVTASQTQPLSPLPSIATPISNIREDQPTKHTDSSPDTSQNLQPGSPSGSKTVERARARSTTNPFLRKDATKDVKSDYIPSPNVWDDPFRSDQDVSSLTDKQEDLIDLGPSTQSTSAGPLESENRPDQKLPEKITLPPPEDSKQSNSAPLRSANTSIPDPKKQRNEFYQIKHIRWFDASSKENPRHSSILTQNANGPCPLLALVNCLVLSTPGSLQTPLVEALRTREQISLGLLLDAVFDELTSDRRCSSSIDLPDVAELYSFLVTLHTGMNVNPRFIASSNLKRISSAEVIPGMFEETREVSLYGAFSIPLIHGWLPHRNESAFEAFERIAPTYEDAQNVQFREEELEDKLSLGTLTSDEQLILEDVKTIKQFLIYWPTQLTAHGLDVVDRFLKPGDICIMFRNDHFSTVHKEAYSNRLMTLVTDAGFATHDEIVWESLVDINGTNSEFCSGDFRSVSHNDQVGSSTLAPPDDDNGWTTVESKKIKKVVGGTTKSGGAQATKSQLQGSLSPAQTSGSSRGSRGFGSANAFDLPDRSQRDLSASEQEDLDLALALQLQEEEEERERAEAASRARENSLSEQFISRETVRSTAQTPAQSSTASGIRAPPVQIPVRRSGQTQNNSTTAQPQRSEPQRAAPQAARPADNESEPDGAPPPYEFAAAAAPFHPPRHHPASEHAPRTPLPPSTQNTPAYGTNSTHPFRNPAAAGSSTRITARQGLYEQDAAFGIGRRGRAQPMINASAGDRDGDRCVMM